MEGSGHVKVMFEELSLCDSKPNLSTFKTDLKKRIPDLVFCSPETSHLGIAEEIGNVTVEKKPQCKTDLSPLLGLEL